MVHYDLRFSFVRRSHADESVVRPGACDLGDYRRRDRESGIGSARVGIVELTKGVMRWH